MSRFLLPYLLFFAHSLWAETTYFPLEDLRPGMRGLTYTVLQGNKIEPLQTEIMGVAKNFLGPGQDLIIAKLVDSKTELTGAVHGMSGSPLYIDGKLVGALSRGLVGFIKDGQCGFTPIRDMMDVSKMGHDVVPASDSPFALSHGQADHAQPMGQTSPGRYLSIPLAISGLPERMTDQLLEKYGLKAMGLSAAPGGGTSPSTDLGPDRLVPGAPISAVFMSGDVSIAGTGTVTWREGDKILAFGHPMFGAGSSNWPMGTAEIITTLPSYEDPQKMANQGEVVGTIQQDRASAIFGQVGVVPSMAPYRVEQIHNGIVQKPLEGKFFSDPMITPMLVASLIMEALAGGNHISREFSLSMSGELMFAGFPALQLDGLFSGENDDLAGAVFEQLQAISVVMGQPWSKPQATGLHLVLKTTEAQQVWQIERVALEQSKLEPGKVMEVTVDLRQRYGAHRQERFAVPLPEGMKSGEIEVRVAGGQSLDQRSLFEELRAIKETAELIDRLNRKRSRAGLYLQLVTRSPGEVVAQYELPSLPDSVRAVMSTTTQSENPVSLNERIWVEVSHHFDGVVEGMKQVNLEIQ